MRGCCAYQTGRRDGEPGAVWKVKLPSWLSLDADKVERMRRRSIARRDEMIALQKEFGPDRDAAKFFKGEATDALKEYRAACLVLGMLVSVPPNDGAYQPEWNWPVELAPWIDRVIWASE